MFPCVLELSVYYCCIVLGIFVRVRVLIRCVPVHSLWGRLLLLGSFVYGLCHFLWELIFHVPYVGDCCYLVLEIFVRVSCHFL